MTKLTDTQLVLLSTAGQRSDGNLLPVPDTLGTLDARLRKAIASLVKRGLAAETGGVDAAYAWSSDGNLHFGAVITEAGKKALGVAEPDDSDTAAALPPVQPPATTKRALIIDLMSRAEGATLSELIAATGWLPHTTRAALTGLRKSGYVLTKSVRDNATCYTIKRGS